MSNSNALAGIRCPKCDQEDAFDIAATVSARVIDNGVEWGTDYTWDNDSSISCVDCGHAGTVAEFST